MQCGSCGKLIEAESNFCGECGSPIGNDLLETEAPAPQVQAGPMLSPSSQAVPGVGQGRAASSSHPAGPTVERQQSVNIKGGYINGSINVQQDGGSAGSAGTGKQHIGETGNKAVSVEGFKPSPLDQDKPVFGLKLESKKGFRKRTGTRAFIHVTNCSSIEYRNMQFIIEGTIDGMFRTDTAYLRQLKPGRTRATDINMFPEESGQFRIRLIVKYIDKSGVQYECKPETWLQVVDTGEKIPPTVQQIINNNYRIGYIDGDITTLQPVEIPITHTLTVSTDGTGVGGVLLSPGGGQYKPGTNVTLTAEPGPNSEFKGWRGALTGGPGNMVCTVMMNADMVVNATFDRKKLSCRCDAELEPGMAACPECGMQIITKCPKCSTEILPNSITCTCGTEIHRRFKITLEPLLSKGGSTRAKLTIRHKDTDGGTWLFSTRYLLVCNEREYRVGRYYKVDDESLYNDMVLLVHCDGEPFCEQWKDRKSLTYGSSKGLSRRQMDIAFKDGKFHICWVKGTGLGSQTGVFKGADQKTWTELECGGEHVLRDGDLLGFRGKVQFRFKTVTRSENGVSRVVGACLERKTGVLDLENPVNDDEYEHYYRACYLFQNVLNIGRQGTGGLVLDCPGLSADRFTVVKRDGKLMIVDRNRQDKTPRKEVEGY